MITEYKKCPCGLTDSLICVTIDEKAFEQCGFCGLANISLTGDDNYINMIVENLSEIAKEMMVETDNGQVFVPYFNVIGENQYSVYLDKDDSVEDGEAVYRISPIVNGEPDMLNTETFGFFEFAQLINRVNVLAQECQTK